MAIDIGIRDIPRDLIWRRGDAGGTREEELENHNWALLLMTHRFIKEYILAVDRKAAFLLTGLFALLALSANALGLTQGLPNLRPVTLVLLAMAGGTGMFAIVCSAWVVYPPKTSPHREEELRNGYIYWERILQHNNQSEFVDAVTSLDSEQATRELAKNTYNIAGIASTKYRWFRKSMGLIGVMGYFSLIAIVYQWIPSLSLFRQFHTFLQDSLAVTALVIGFIIATSLVGVVIYVLIVRDQR